MGHRVLIKKLPPGPEREELRFDRCRFDPAFQPDRYRRSPEEMAAFDEGLTVNGAVPIPDDSEIDWEYLKREVRKAGGLPPSSVVTKAVQDGEPWALAATTENIFKLPRKMALALIWRFWGGLSSQEIGCTLRLKGNAVDQLLFRAKKVLAVPANGK